MAVRLTYTLRVYIINYAYFILYYTTIGDCDYNNRRRDVRLRAGGHLSARRRSRRTTANHVIIYAAKRRIF